MGVLIPETIQENKSIERVSHLAALLESTQDPIWSVDRQHRLAAFNRAFASGMLENFGVRVVAGMSPAEMLPEADAAVWAGWLERAEREERTGVEFQLKSGRYLEITFNTIFEGGEKSGIACFGKDTTDRRRAEEQGEKTEARFRTLVEESPMAIRMARDGRHLYGNRRFHELFGVPSGKDLEGADVRVFYGAESLPLIEEQIRLHREGTAGSTDYEAMGRRGDGTLFPMRVKVAEVTLPDGPAVIAFFLDMTEVTRSEQALRESEQRFRTLFEEAPHAIGMGRAGKLIQVNRRYTEMFGFREPAELIGRSFTELWAAESLPRVEERARQQEMGVFTPVELRGLARRRNGEEFPALLQAGKVELADGPAMLGYLVDMTELREAEEALRLSEERFRSFFDLPLVGMGVGTIERKIVAVNNRLCEILGYTREELLGADWSVATQGEDAGADRGAFERMLSGESGVYSATRQFVRKDGKTIWTAISAACIRDQAGKPSMICCVMEDISEKKAAEEAIRLAEREYRSIFEEAPEGIFKLGADSRLQSISPGGARMLGYDSSEEAAHTMREGLHCWVSRDERSAFIERLEQEGQVQDLECAWRQRDGTPFFASVTARRISDEKGRAAYYQGFFQDITERKHLESELRQHLREVLLLSEMNRALLKAESEEELLSEYCRIAVEAGGYRMAWVGIAHPGTNRQVTPVAHYGAENGYLSRAKVMLDGGEFSKGPTGRAIALKSPQVTEDIASDPGMAPFRDEALSRGFSSIIAVPFQLSADSVGCLTAYADTTRKWSEAERRLVDQFAAALGYGIRTVRTAAEKEQYERDLMTSLEQTIQVIAETVDQRDPYTAGHQRRVADLATRIAQKMGLAEERIQGLGLAATIHDLGKMGVPAEILTKPGKLTPTQISLIREHVQMGYDIIRNVKFPWPIADIVRQNHERLDGSGYPQGLKGEEILLEARILAVADVTEAMASHRPYRESLGTDAALEEIVRRRGKYFDADVVEACLSVFREDGYVFPS